jgi:hypothetical protein
VDDSSTPTAHKHWTPGRTARIARAGATGRVEAGEAARTGNRRRLSAIVPRAAVRQEIDDDALRGHAERGSRMCPRAAARFRRRARPRRRFAVGASKEKRLGLMRNPGKKTKVQGDNGPVDLRCGSGNRNLNSKPQPNHARRW